MLQVAENGAEMAEWIPRYLGFRDFWFVGEVHNTPWWIVSYLMRR